MKKWIALLMALVLCVSFAACGGKEETVAAESAAEAEPLPTEDWVNIYTDTPVTLKADMTMTLGENSGTWERSGGRVTFTYKTENGTIIRGAELIEENGFTLLRADKNGTINGAERIFGDSDYYPADQIEEAKEVVDLEKEDEPAETPESKPAEEEHPDLSYAEWKASTGGSDSGSFTNAYGTAGTTCAVSGCDKPIVSSGDSNCCSTHSNRCGECNKYIDGDAMFCMDCLADAINSLG